MTAHRATSRRNAPRRLVLIGQRRDRSHPANATSAGKPGRTTIPLRDERDRSACLQGPTGLLS